MVEMIVEVEIKVEDVTTYFPSCNFLFLSFFCSSFFSSSYIYIHNRIGFSLWRSSFFFRFYPSLYINYYVNFSHSNSYMIFVDRLY